MTFYVALWMHSTTEFPVNTGVYNRRRD